MPKPYRTVIHWFRRIIRLDDNRAFHAACIASDQVVPVFILDPRILTHDSTGPARTRFLFESLADLDVSLRKRGSRLIVRHGEPAEQLRELVAETHAVRLFYSRDYGVFSRKRDEAVDRAMRELGVLIETSADLLVSEPGDVLSNAGTPYTVFTPYKRVWLEQPAEDPVPAPSTVATPPELRSEPLPELPSAYGVAGSIDQKVIVQGGETEARARMDRFLEASIRAYDTDRDFPGQEGTSRLSAALKMGVLSARRILFEIRSRTDSGGVGHGRDTFVSELAWRDFYYQILFHFPHVVQGGAFKPAFDAIEWDNNSERFDAWCKGQTGYPIVDAAQRQLNSEAWMHNRARMVTASFLTKDLLCDWRWGERYFMQKLIDGDFASNNGGWQWAAGTGTDAQPYFRIFNPILQGEKFDPKGAYVRRWVPELAKMPTKFIHRPWDLPAVEQAAIGCVIGRDYPAPIVDHKVQREKALAMYKRGVQSQQKDDEGAIHGS